MPWWVRMALPQHKTRHVPWQAQAPVHHFLQPGQHRHELVYRQRAKPEVWLLPASFLQTSCKLQRWFAGSARAQLRAMLASPRTDPVPQAWTETRCNLLRKQPTGCLPPLQAANYSEWTLAAATDMHNACSAECVHAAFCLS